MKVLSIIGLISGVIGIIYTIHNCIYLYKILKNSPENCEEKISNTLTHFAICGFLLGLGLGAIFDIFDIF
jgi:hypothetical protein